MNRGADCGVADGILPDGVKYANANGKITDTTVRTAA